jgi:hypothetical protein
VPAVKATRATAPTACARDILTKLFLNVSERKNELNLDEDLPGKSGLRTCELVLTISVSDRKHGRSANCGPKQFASSIDAMASPDFGSQNLPASSRHTICVRKNCELLALSGSCVKEIKERLITSTVNIKILIAKRINLK